MDRLEAVLGVLGRLGRLGAHLDSLGGLRPAWPTLGVLRPLKKLRGAPQKSCDPPGPWRAWAPVKGNYKTQRRELEGARDIPTRTSRGRVADMLHHWR